MNILNCEVRSCTISCLEAGTSSNINVRGSSFLAGGAEAIPAGVGRPDDKRSQRQGPTARAGMILRGSSKANVAKSLWKGHATAVAAYNSDLVFEANCVLDIGDKAEEAGKNLF
jgi:hypothetical protein